MTSPQFIRVGIAVASGLIATLVFLIGFVNPASAYLEKTGGWDGGDTIRPFTLNAVAVDAAGNAYVADSGLSRIVRIDPEGKADLEWGTGEPGMSYPPNPSDLTVDDDGNVYALDMEGKQVRKYSPTGELLTSWPIDSAYYGGGWSITWESGKVWVLTETRVSGFMPDGTPVHPAAENPFTFASIPNYITPLITGDGNGHLIVASAAWIYEGTSATKSIYRFNTDGSLLSKWDSPAKVTHVKMTVGDYYTVTGYFNLAVDPDGNIWVSTSDTDHPFKKIDASGLLPGGFGDATFGGRLTIDSQNRFWTIGSNPEHSAEDQVRRTEADGTDLKTWGVNDFPDYADQVWPASFRQIDDFSVDSSGKVAILDTYFHRVKVFTAAGNFLRMVKIPDQVGRYLGGVSKVNLADDGTIEVYDGHAGKLLRFDSSGAPAGESGFDLPGPLLAFQRTADGGHLVVSEPGTVIRFDSDGHATGSWPLGRATSDYDSVAIVQGSAGDVYVSTPHFIDRFSATGERLGSWSLLDQECTDKWVDGFASLSADAAGNIYASASLSFQARWSKLYAFDPNLDLTWSENLDEGWGTLVKVAPDGSFLAAGAGINRIAHTGPEELNLVTSCREQPDRFRLLGVRYGPKRTWAKLRIHIPGPGELKVFGPKVMPKSRQAAGAGNYTIKVKPRPRYLKPRHPRRKLKLKVRITYRGESGTTRRNLKLQFTRALRRGVSGQEDPRVGPPHSS